MVKQIDTMAEFEKELSDAGSKPVFVDFTATWCGPCKMIGPVFEQLAKENEEMIFVKVDVDENEDVAAKYEVSAMPTFIVIKDKTKVDQMVGADKEKLKALVLKFKQ